jgi:hypothetical protein
MIVVIDAFTQSITPRPRLTVAESDQVFKQERKAAEALQWYLDTFVGRLQSVFPAGKEGPEWEQIRDANVQANAAIVDPAHLSHVDLVTSQAWRVYRIFRAASRGSVQEHLFLPIDEIESLSLESIAPHWEALQGMLREIPTLACGIDVLLAEIEKEGRRARLASRGTAKPQNEGVLSPADLAEKYQKPRAAVRKALERFRRTCDDGWIEVQNRKPREPQYLYYEEAVRELVRAVSPSSERPAKKNSVEK